MRSVFLAVALLTCFYANAQSFNMQNGDTVHNIGWNYFETPNFITNTTANPFTVNWQVIDDNFPASWSTANAINICDNNNAYTNLNNNK